MSSETDMTQEQVVLQVLCSLSDKVDRLATREELKEVKERLSLLVPRNELEIANKVVERDMDEIRKAIESVTVRVEDLNTKVDHLKEDRLPTWISHAFTSVFISLFTLFIVWAIDHGTIPLAK